MKVGRMALSEPVERELMHTRRIEMQGFIRADGLLDIDARLVDTKPYTFANDESGEIPAGRPLHEMRVRMTVDDTLLIVACEAETVHGPYAECAGGPANMGSLVGLALKAGFVKAANERLRGALGCTHIREMLQQMATVAHQSMWPVRERRRAREMAEAQRRNPGAAPPLVSDEDTHEGAERMLNSCTAYSAAGAVVRQRWPHLYSGPRDAAAEPHKDATAAG
jgi:hypothetical protein